MNKSESENLFFSSSSSCPFQRWKFVDADKADIRIGVISDIHLIESTEVQKEETNLLKALLTFRENDIDVLIAAGDIADAGEAGAYSTFSKMFTRVYGNDNPPKKVWVMGNHDYWNKLSAEQAQQRFQDVLGVGLNYSIVVKGYTFIGVSTEDGETNGTYTKKTTDWLAAELEKAAVYAPDKPIFVAVHHPVTGTVFDNYGWNNPALSPILEHYSQVILFAGHTHFPLQDPRAIFQKSYTSVDTASLSYVYAGTKEPSTLPMRDADKVAQGLMVTVNDSEVRIKRLDFRCSQMIETDWIIPFPISKSSYYYTDKRALLSTAPYFPAGSAITLSGVTDNSCTITFPSAHHPDFVFSYKVQAVDIATGAIVSELFAFSDFYLGISCMSSVQSFCIKGLVSNKAYEIRVVAAESYGLQSKPLTALITLR